MRLALLLVLAVLAAAPSSAQIQQGNCSSTGSAVADLAANNVRARLYNNGGLFWNGGANVYNVPAVLPGQSITPNAMFAAGIWVGGLVNGQPRVAATDFGPWEFYAGPLDSAGGLVDPTCSVYDRIWVVNQDAVRDYRNGLSTPLNLSDWPVGLGAPAFVDANGNGVFDQGEAEVTVSSVDQTIDLGAGELPLFPGDGAADEMAFTVYNDVGGAHGTTGSAPIGLEVRQLAYAFNLGGAIGNTTFYKYDLFYGGSVPLTNAYIGLFSDPDLGNASDDYVGSDAALGYGYVYNADNQDEGSDGYGTAPPALGVNVLQGPLVDAPGQTWTDPDGTTYQNRTRLGMTVFLNYNNTTGPSGNARPSSGDWYNYLQGIWQDGNPMVDCGDGYGPTNTGLSCASSQQPTAFMWPGDPLTGSFWSETNFDGAGSANTAGDRRFLQSTGPFEFQPGERQTIQFGIVWSRGNDNLNSVSKLREDMQTIVSAFDSHFGSLPAPTLPSGTPQLLSPASGASLANSIFTVAAQTSGPDDQVQIQVARNDTFTEGAQRFADGQTVVFEPGDYFARTRYVAGSLLGPWSDASPFTVRTDVIPPYNGGGLASFEVTSNAAGPVVPVQPAAGAFAGFPTPDITGDGQGDSPTDEQQVGPARWLMYAGGGTGSYDSFLSRSITGRGRSEADLAGRTFEIRFTDSGSVSYRRYQDAAVVSVPFEVWSSPSATPNDPSDDVRLIPAILDYDFDNPGNADGVFNLSSFDSPVSSGEDDPFTDWIYIHEPVDKTPGTAGYDKFAGSGTIDESQVDTELFARIVFVNWNAGIVPPYDQEMPETGTVFRITTSGETEVVAPMIVGPSNGTAFDAAPELFWQQQEGASASVQIATDASFSSPLAFTGRYTSQNTSGRLVIDQLDSGSYFWRVLIVTQAGDSLLSGVGSFSTSRTTADTPEETPQSLTLLSPSPHPVSGPSRLRFYLPQSSDVRMEAYDLMGRRVAVLAEGSQSQGWREAAWPEGLSAGVYLVRLRAGAETQTRQVVVVR